MANSSRDIDGPLLLGVDAGGTRCRARVTDAKGNRVGEGVAAAANVLTDPHGAWTSIEQAVQAAMDSAAGEALPLEDMVAVLGCAGLDPATLAAPAAWPLGRFRACRLETDAFIAQQGAFGGGDGAILIVGTGSVGVFVRGNERITVGGYGAEVSDEGSGAWIGRQAIRRSLWAFDERAPKSALTDLVLQAVGAPPAAQEWANTARPSDYAALAPLVLSAVDAHDPQAAHLMAEAADHLGQMLIRLAHAGARQVCLMGGLAAAIRPWLRTNAVEIVEPQGSALDGALLLARDLAASQVPCFATDAA